MSKYYIDANKLLQELNEAQTEGDEYYKGLGKAKRIARKQSAADVEEVRHGKWIYRSYHPRMGHAFECSVCKRWMFTAFLKSVVEEYPYCHCGAKMESVEGLQEDENG